MLGTLMKYEFKAIGRILLPLYGAWFIVAIMLGLSLRGESSGNVAGYMIALTGALYAFCSVAAIVITAIILIQRFYKNLLGNEGYFMFALPVSTGKHMTNKIISSAVWAFIGVLVAILTALAIAVSIEGFESVFNGMDFVFGEIKLMLNTEPSSFLIIIEILILIFVALAETAAKVFAAISIGHQWGNHRLLGAILAYVGIGIVEGILGSFIEMLFSFVALDWYYELDAMTQGHLAVLLVLVCCGALLAVYWFVSWVLLDRRLNLE